MKILSFRFLFIKQGNMIKMKFSMQCGFRDILNIKLHATVFESEFHGPRLFTFHATHSLRTDGQLKKSFFCLWIPFLEKRGQMHLFGVVSFVFFLFLALTLWQTFKRLWFWLPSNIFCALDNAVFCWFSFALF